MNKKRKRIALFVGQADESYQSKFITGFLANAFVLDMDVCVFSMYHKYQNTVNREKGESNIFSLMQPDKFDGAVLLKDTIQTAGAAQDLEEKLHNSFDKPVLVIEQDSPYFPSIFTDCRGAITELVSHLIEVHGYKDIAYLSGRSGHKHATQRLDAFLEAMDMHGLSVDKDRIFYGDFWYTSGESFADMLINSEKELPDAVICANDAMAVGLCMAFSQNGIKIPDDIAVASYDSTFEGQTSPKSITSALIPAEDTGRYAARYMNDKINGRETEPFDTLPYLVIGESCGCTETNIPEFDMKRREWKTDLSNEGFDSVNNTMAEDLLEQTDLDDFLGTVYSYAYQIKDVKCFHLALCDKWRSIGREEVSCGNEGYTEDMVYAVRFNSDHKDGLAGTDKLFKCIEMLPDLDDEREAPRAVFFTPVFSDNNCFGYAAVEYGSTPRCYDDIYRRWIALVARGFESLRRYMTEQYLQTKVEKLKNGKYAAMAAVYESLDDDEKADYELVGQILDGNLLSYRFQPIVNTVDGGIYSYEALMRSATDKRVPPLSIVKYADMQNRLADVEKATFLNVLGIVEKNAEKLGGAKVFINSIPGVKLTQEDLERVERYLHGLSDKVVVELTEESELANDELEQMKARFRRLDVKIAIDDYGTGYSNVNNLLRYMPNYVKIDRALLSDIQNKPQKLHFVKEIISFCHDNDILALAEGVETSEELRTVIMLGADLIQGFYTARPSTEFLTEIDPAIRNEIMNYHKEFSRGGAAMQYIAGKTNRIPLPLLVRNGITEIVVGQGDMIYKDITVFSTPGLKTNVHITVENGHSGRITLENVYLSNDLKSPCIDLGDNTDVTLVFEGENTLHNTGVHVPESSNLIVEGSGNVKVDLRTIDFYGFGGSLKEKHGKMVFSQSGLIEISAHANNGVCIGSGLGGKIRVCSGKYIIDTNGQDLCCIGSVYGDADVKLNNASISLEFNGLSGVGAGSVKGNSKVSMHSCSLRLYGDGSSAVGIGSVEGDLAEFTLIESGAFMSLNGTHVSGIGTLKGRSVINMTMSGLKIEASGTDAVASGGKTEDIVIYADTSDLKWNVKTGLDTDCFVKRENFTMINGSTRFLLNGKEISR